MDLHLAERPITKEKFSCLSSYIHTSLFPLIQKPTITNMPRYAALLRHKAITVLPIRY